MRNQGGAKGSGNEANRNVAVTIDHLLPPLRSSAAHIHNDFFFPYRVFIFNPKPFQTWGRAAPLFSYMEIIPPPTPTTATTKTPPSVRGEALWSKYCTYPITEGGVFGGGGVAER